MDTGKGNLRYFSSFQFPTCFTYHVVEALYYIDYHAYWSVNYADFLQIQQFPIIASLKYLQKLVLGLFHYDNHIKQYAYPSTSQLSSTALARHIAMHSQHDARISIWLARPSSTLIGINSDFLTCL